MYKIYIYMYIYIYIYIYMYIYIRAVNGSMGHGSMVQMGHSFWMGQWVIGQSL